MRIQYWDLCDPAAVRGYENTWRAARPTIVLLQQLHGGEQHGSVLGVPDVQLVQVLLLQQLERVQILVAIKEEGGKMLLWSDDAKLNGLMVQKQDN